MKYHPSPPKSKKDLLGSFFGFDGVGGLMRTLWFDPMRPAEHWAPSRFGGEARRVKTALRLFWVIPPSPPKSKKDLLGSFFGFDEMSGLMRTLWFDPMRLAEYWAPSRFGGEARRVETALRLFWVVPPSPPSNEMRHHQTQTSM